MIEEIGFTFGLNVSERVLTLAVILAAAYVLGKMIDLCRSPSKSKEAA